ncbi:MAG: type II toxin-antitoxin system HipA family toxin [Methylophilus sp.]
MTSDKRIDEAYVWIWLPKETQPVVAGRIARKPDGKLIFNYGQSYLARKNAIAIYEPELPLQAGEIPLRENMQLPSCIRDASPDAWGRRVIINRTLGLKGRNADSMELDEMTYLLESGSDRIGALDFQYSAREYVAREHGNATLDELMISAERVEQGVPLSPELDLALQHGTALGGARPKALIIDNHKKYIAKFSMSNDLYGMVKAEFIAMRLASVVGLNVAPVKLTQALGKDVLLIERFDRIVVQNGWARRAIVSALTLLELDETEARYASYEDLATLIRHRFTEPTRTLEELFGRIVFNILSGNTDDHARNHAAFWDGQALTLTPAYDICPQSRTGGEASQAMLIIGNNRFSQLTVCLEAATHFLLQEDRARAIISAQLETIRAQWDTVCDEANLSEVDRVYLWGRQFLNPFALEGWL